MDSPHSCLLLSSWKLVHTQAHTCYSVYDLSSSCVDASRAMNPQQLVRVLGCFVVGMLVCECVLVAMEWNQPRHRSRPVVTHSRTRDTATASSLQLAFDKRPGPLQSPATRFREDPRPPLLGASAPSVDQQVSEKRLVIRRPMQLLVHPSQNVSCQLGPLALGNITISAAHSCGVLVDGVGVSTTSFRHRSARLFPRLIEDMLLASSKHLPYFDEIPRAVVLWSDDVPHAQLDRLAAARVVVVKLTEEDVHNSSPERFPSAVFQPGARSLFVVPRMALGQNESVVRLTPFDVMRLSPFARTLFVNSSFGIPSRRRIAPPTLLFRLLDSFDLLLTPLPFVEEALLKLQRAHCWPLSDAFSQSGLLPGQFFVGNLFHSAFALYRRLPSVEALFRRADDALRHLTFNRRAPGSQQTCKEDIVEDPLLRGSFALHHAQRVSPFVKASLFGDEEMLELPSVGIVDPIHCADARYGLDPCSRVLQRPSKKKRYERHETFRCDWFRD